MSNILDIHYLFLPKSTRNRETERAKRGYKLMIALTCLHGLPLFPMMTWVIQSLITIDHCMSVWNIEIRSFGGLSLTKSHPLIWYLSKSCMNWVHGRAHSTSLYFWAKLLYKWLQNPLYGPHGTNVCMHNMSWTWSMIYQLS